MKCIIKWDNKKRKEKSGKRMPRLRAGRGAGGWKRLALAPRRVPPALFTSWLDIYSKSVVVFRNTSQLCCWYSDLVRPKFLFFV